MNNTTVNVAISHALVSWNRLYNHQGRSYKNQLGVKPSKVGVVKNGCYHEIRSWHEVLFSHSGSNTSHSIVILLLTLIANCLQKSQKAFFVELRDQEWFFAIFAESEHFRVYVAS